VLQVCRLERVVAPSAARGDGDGDGVSREVCDETRDAWEELDVWPARVLRCGALGTEVVDREWDVWEEGEQVLCELFLGCSKGPRTR
jgi:hypothetical protein